ncbi:MAG: mannose-1-phosphate guanylyltransferase/mannose-6-phosphate isomerase [Gammaproteobacteria bacterium WSBS_2016_MAG_OTU1]
MSASNVNSLAVTPLIICGGSGSRLWPASRQTLAKPFVKLPGVDKSLLAETYARLHHATTPLSAIITIAAADSLFLCQEIAAAHAPAVPHWFIGEPQGRNTAPAILTAATMAAKRLGDETILLALPADHLVGQVEAFWQSAAQAAKLAHQGRFALLGITPDYAATGYGYIECGAVEGGGFAVNRFVEKPDLSRAEAFIAAGNFLWNAGIFCMTAKTLFAELPTVAPQLQQNLAPLLKNLDEHASEKNDVWLPPADIYAAFDNISFDYAVMEKTDKASVVATDAEWSDVGSWRAVSKTQPTDSAGNVCAADAILNNCHNCFVYGDSRFIAAIDVDDLHIIDTPDALLVAPAASAEKVRDVFAYLQKQSRPEATTPVCVRRPWGSYTVLSAATGYKVKRIEVLPGGMLSLQSHNRRSEHWTTVEGIMTIVIDEREFVMPVNESCYIPQGAKHRMMNKTDAVAAIVEVQIGDYLEEDDIVRYEDVYGRI